MDKKSDIKGLMNVFDQVLSPFALHTKKALRMKIRLKQILRKMDKLKFNQTVPTNPTTGKVSWKINDDMNRMINAQLTDKTDLAAIAPKITQIAGIAGGSTLGALGLGAGYSAMQDNIESSRRDKELGKIKTSLALQELQSDTGTEETAFGKNSSMADHLPTALLMGGVLTAGAIPTYIAGKWLRDVKAGDAKGDIKDQINRYRKIYDRKFKESVMEDQGVEPADLSSIVAEMGKTSKLSDLLSLKGLKNVGTKSTNFVLDNATEVGTGLAGIGLGTAAFVKGKKEGEQSSDNIAKMKAYREMLDRVSRLRNAPVIVTDQSFSPEEMIAMEKLRTESPSAKKSKKTIKKVKPEPEASVSADIDNPELQDLLGSI